MCRAGPTLVLLLAAAFTGCGGDEVAEETAYVHTYESVRADFASAQPDRILPALAWLAALDPAPLDWLHEGLTHADRGVREWSAHALGDILPRDAQRVPPKLMAALIASFDDDDDYVRWKAARALGNIGPAAKDALPVLEVAARADREGEVVRAAAKRAVALIRGDPHKALDR